jgi:hypothetical protein
MRAFALLLLVGCWSGNSPDPAPPQNIEPATAKPAPPRRRLTEIEAAVARMRGFAGQMCACKDRVCADEVQQELTSWSTSMAGRERDPEERPSEALMKEMQEIGMHYAECMMKAMDPAANP